MKIVILLALLATAPAAFAAGPDFSTIPPARNLVESKATFGDPYEIRRHIKKQLQPYSDLFGDGAVVYWFGHVDDQTYALPEGVDIISPTFFEAPPVPFPYVPVGETRPEERSLVPDAIDLPE